MKTEDNIDKRSKHTKRRKDRDRISTYAVYQPLLIQSNKHLFYWEKTEFTHFTVSIEWKT